MNDLSLKYHMFTQSVSEFNEFNESAKNRFQLSAGLNLEKLIKILSGTNHI